jgi:hypothetical protein
LTSNAPDGTRITDQPSGAMAAGEAPPTPADSPLTLADVMGSAAYRELRTPDVEVGDPAPPFTLPLLGSDEGVSLGDFAGERPVALVFGSYT